MKILVVEDDFTSRKILTTMLNKYGECNVAVNGQEAIDAAEEALRSEAPYDLICLDIMMPEVDGQEALKAIRQLEQQYNVRPSEGMKIIMTTCVDSSKEIVKAFHEQCDGYLLKPISREGLVEKLEELGLIQ